MVYKIVIVHEKQFAKDISKLSGKERDRVFQKIEELKDMWHTWAQVKRLKKYPVADFRLRVGEYRVLFDCHMSEGEILLFRVLHRSKLY